MSRYCCSTCDKYISSKFIKKHNKSKSHLLLNELVVKTYVVKDIK